MLKVAGPPRFPEAPWRKGKAAPLAPTQPTQPPPRHLMQLHPHVPRVVPPPPPPPLAPAQPTQPPPRHLISAPPLPPHRLHDDEQEWPAQWLKEEAAGDATPKLEEEASEITEEGFSSGVESDEYQAFEPSTGRGIKRGLDEE